METRSRRRFPFALAASIVGHALLMFALLLPMPPESPSPSADPQASEPVEIDNSLRQFVESEEGGESVLVEGSRFEGERDQKVEEETRAPVVGTFRAGNGETGTSLAPTSEDDAMQNTEGLSMKDLQLGANNSLSEETEDYGMSATDDRLDGIRTGVRTLLTTRESRYSSFYIRAKRQLKAKWETELGGRVATEEARRKAAQRSRWSTRVVATLDSEGRILAAVVTRSSGSPMMDEAARQAFFNVAILHNPPKALFREDGQFFLPWEFNVEMTPTSNAFARSDDADDRFRRME